MLRDVRGKGMMIGIEFGAPDSFALKASWSVLETANKGLFCQLITIPLFKEHKILCQVAGHASHTIKLLPAFVIDRQGLRLDRPRVRRGHRRQPSRARRRLVARQDADRQCHQEPQSSEGAGVAGYVGEQLAASLFFDHAAEFRIFARIVRERRRRIARSFSWVSIER